MTLKDILKKNSKRISKNINLGELMNIININPEAILLDIRNMNEYKEGHLKNAINIPLYDLKQKANNVLISKNAIIIVYCQVGVRSKEAIKILKKLGYKNLYHLENGIQTNRMS